MRALLMTAALACCTFAVPAASAQNHQGGDQVQTEAPTVNAMCPIGKEPIVPTAGTVEYKGNTIGLCCPGCGEQFLAWDEARKDSFVTLAVAHREPGQEHTEQVTMPATGAGVAGPTYPYTLTDCPVGGALGSMGDPIVKVYDNREVRFCCAGCIDDFEGDTPKYWGEIDAKIVEQQLMHYPLAACIVTGEALGAQSVNHVHNNRLVRIASADAVAAFNTDPAKHLAALDEQIIEAQLPGYPMDSCPVGGPLGSMGEPMNFIYMNRLVRFCCGGCEKSLVGDPVKYMAKLDKAYADAQREAYPLDTCIVAGGELGSMGEPYEIVAGTRLVRFCCDGCLPKFRADPAKYLAGLGD